MQHYLWLMNNNDNDSGVTSESLNPIKIRDSFEFSPMIDHCDSDHL